MRPRYSGERWERARAAALARDNNQCQSCGSCGDLHVHHVKPASSFSVTEHAHYVENLVALCEECHWTWEGRDVRPELADPQTETAIQEVVAEWTSDLLWRHCFPAALSELLARHVAGRAGLCSNCLTKIGPGDGPLHILDRIRETLCAVAFYERELPGAPPDAYAEPPVESYCDGCSGRYLRADGATILQSGDPPRRMARAFRVAKLLDPSSVHIGNDLDSGYVFRNGDINPRRWRGEGHGLVLCIARAAGYPTDEVQAITASYAMTDREVREPDPPDETDLDYEEWFLASQEREGYEEYDLSRTESWWDGQHAETD